MEQPLVLAFDIGTQSVRCLLVCPDGSFADVEQRKYEVPYVSPNPGWAEQRPDFYYQQICAAAKELCGRNEALLPRVIAVTLTSIRDTVLCLDENNEPLRNIILWLDKRQADFRNPFPLWKQWIFQLAGMTETTKTLYRATASNWIRQNQPEIWERTAKFVMLPTYLNYKITGKLLDSQANMVGHIPFDYKRRRWKTDWSLTKCICDVEQEKLCELVPSGEVLGYVTQAFSEASGVPAGLPLVATGSDKGCETLGLSVVEKNKAALSFGTTATIQLAVKKYFEPQRFMPAYLAVPNDLYNPEIELYRGFWLVSWFIREFGAAEREKAKELGCSAEEVLNRAIERIPPGCEGLLLQPYWTPGILQPTSRGAVIGFADYHTHIHLYRAIIEGITFELYHSLRNMEKRSGLKIDQLYVAGGGAQSDVVCQITADVFGLPVKRIQTHEASSLGASMVAFLWGGVFRDYADAIGHMVHETDVFEPEKDVHETYMDIYNGAYRKIFGRLEPVYRRIIKITKRRDVQ
ncbi:MAG: FGGY-family carbohydrate kinase [Faecousia sp.]